MSGKQVPICPKPDQNAQQGKLNSQTETWVENREIPKQVGKTKRLTIDIPEELHRNIKSQCALRGLKMSDVIRAGLLKKYGGVKDLD